MTSRSRFRKFMIFTGTFMALLSLTAHVWMLSLGWNSTPPIAEPRAGSPAGSTASPSVSSSAAPSASPLATPSAPPVTETTPAPPLDQPESTPSPDASPPIASVNPGKLIIPVAGIRPDQLHDTYNEARSEGRVHNAIDIPAARGTPVLAAVSGSIIKLFHSERGGTTIYQLSPDNKLVYYYAHLDRYADGLTEGHFVRQGEVIGYVGDTGNAGAGNYHLHFAMWLISDPKHYWEGININPYPLLRGTP